MEDFQFHKPSSLAEAVAAVKGASEGKFVSGGQSLIPAMKLDLASFSDLVSLKGVAEMSGIRAEGDTLIIGANSTHAEVAANPTVKSMIPSLAHLADHIGDPQVRNRGTIGGSIAHADPAADYPAAIVALNATIETDRRTIGGDAFFTGFFETALAEDEIIKAVHFPKPEKAFYSKFPNPASKYALAGVMVAKMGGGVRVAVTGAAAQVFRVAAMESALAANFAPGAIADIKVPTDDLTDELDASPDYKAHLINVMARRAVAQAC
ncbi:MAG: xanthine dehydrogenase family protein subunit M [Myxococcota bacterium]